MVTIELTKIGLQSIFIVNYNNRKNQSGGIKPGLGLVEREGGSEERENTPATIVP